MCIIIIPPQNVDKISWACNKIFLCQNWIRIGSVGFDRGSKTGEPGREKPLKQR